MADVELTYKGTIIGSLSDTNTLTLETAGKYCEADILLSYTRPSGGIGLGFISQDSSGFLVLSSSGYPSWQGGSY